MSLPTFIVLVVAFSFGMIQMPALVKQKLKREAAAYFVFLTAGTACSILAANLTITPSPLNAIIWFYEPFNHFFDQLFHS